MAFGGLEKKPQRLADGGHQHDAADRRDAGAARDLHHHGAAVHARDPARFAEGVVAGRCARRRTPSRFPSTTPASSTGTTSRSRSTRCARGSPTAGKRPSRPEIHLRASGATRYDVIAQVMGAAQQAGLDQIGFVAPKAGKRNSRATGRAPTAGPPLYSFPRRFHADRGRNPATCRQMSQRRRIRPRGSRPRVSRVAERYNRPLPDRRVDTTEDPSPSAAAPPPRVNRRVRPRRGRASFQHQPNSQPHHAR